MGALLVFLAFACSWAEGSSVKVKTMAQIQVQVPEYLQKAEGGFTNRPLQFGAFPPSGFLRLQVYYTTISLCSTTDTVSQYSFFPSPSAHRSRDGRTVYRLDSPFILMAVTGGECRLDMQAQQAYQQLGASAIVLLTSSDANDTDDISRHGFRVPIPAFSMTSLEARNITTFLQSGSNSNRNSKLLMEIAFKTQSPEDRVVEYEFWSQPGDPAAGHDFVDAFKEIAVALGKRASFTPHHAIFDGFSFGCRDPQNNKEKCPGLCTNNNRYCAFNPPGDLFPTISGADIVAETLRRLCIWSQHSTEADGVGLVWWNYVQSFSKTCAISPQQFASQTCIQNACDHAGIDSSKIDLCMTYSGGLLKDLNNTVLEPELRTQQREFVVYSPAAFVNGALVQDNHGIATSDPRSVLQAICAEFPEVSAPAVCSECLSCDDLKGCAASGGVCSSNKPSCGVGEGAKTTPPAAQGSSSSSTGEDSLVVLLVFFAVIMGIILAFVLHWFYLKRLQPGCNPRQRDCTAQQFQRVKDECDNDLDIPGTDLS